VVQIVNGDPLEVAAAKNGTVRAYVLSPDLAQPVAVGDRKVTLGVVAERPETVVLVPTPLSTSLWATGTSTVIRSASPSA
jgi:hypothetical protein